MISVSITHYNNSRFIKDALTIIKDDDRINEIIINDDKSTPIELNEMANIVNNLNNKKIKVYQNNENLGNFINKIRTAMLCSNDWIILLDADNKLTKDYIDAIYKEKIINNGWDIDTIYAPCQAITFPGEISPVLTFSFMEGKYIDIKNIGDFINGDKFNKVNMDCCLNVGNYFVNKKKFLEVMKPFYNYNRGRLSNVDYLMTNTEWLVNGNKIKVVKNMRYYHRVHNDSCYHRSNQNEGQQITKRCCIILKQKSEESKQLK